ncbi:adenosylcobinamide-GDP ribazoletransferase [Actinokineospora fastidiosa]|uniref:Adenosylcobinamide-GDP ribazoletransferase n=1 Tax=Actinokineospora fastidiosa TaxID=1816 RepID=A0A918LFL9_9PSEU|nr:adenosylcobinamide-GDP ribazoletransferase [Actinokineospora fastidiosa]GGS40750.1 adenosylcobinamide-GDP ribazoletransferase [Actinokineospora fastidiosa]
MRLAFSWLTVLPLHVSSVDRKRAARAIAVAPVVGIALGGVVAGLLWTAQFVGMPPLLAGFLAVAFLAATTRGMHIDGLADTADGLGCYGPPERALAVMRDGGAGPFAVAALIVVMGGQAAAFAALEPDRLGVAVLAVAAGRIAFTACCLRGVPAARPEGLGALVAGTQPWPVPAAWLLAAIGAAILASPWAWTGVALAAVVVAVLVRHVRRRIEGVTGDVLGAACELATLAVLVPGAL